jgi:hypothetical protein
VLACEGRSNYLSAPASPGYPIQASSGTAFR